MIRPIILYPEPSLRQKTKPVTFPLSQEVLDHIGDLRDTLAATSGALAIASNQVLAEGWRLFVTKDNVYFNPTWSRVPESELREQREGCLSFPGLAVAVPRHNLVWFEFDDENGNSTSLKASGLFAQEVQHECDHLDGKLFIDGLPRKKRVEIRNKYLKDRKEGKL